VARLQFGLSGPVPALEKTKKPKNQKTKKGKKTPECPLRMEV
jgi:hypothetical protein